MSPQSRREQVEFACERGLSERRACRLVGLSRSCLSYQLWRQLPRRRPGRRIATGRPRPLAPANANFLWAYDFVFDATAAGQQIKCLTVVDEFTRECLAIDVAGSIRSRCVIEVLTRLVSVYGAQLFLPSDNEPEFVSRANLEWIEESGIATSLIDPGRPWKNGSNESFNGKLCDECLNLE